MKGSLKRLWLWLATVFAEYFVLQLFSAASVAYLGGEWLRPEAEEMPSVIPPLFWSIFFLIVLLCTMRRAFILPFMGWCAEAVEWWYRPSPLRKEIDAMMVDVRHASTPTTLNPEDPGNPHFITAVTSEKLHLLHAKLAEQELPPEHPLPDPEDDLKVWYLYLKRIRSLVD